MKYKLFSLLFLLTIVFSSFAGLFQLGGDLAGIAFEAAFDPIIRSVGGDLGKLSAHEIDLLLKKGVLMWPPGATKDEISKLKKLGYKPQLSWSAPGTPYAYDKDAWIEEFRAEREPKNVLPPMLPPFNEEAWIGKFMNIHINPNLNPIDAAEILRKDYYPIVIQISRKIRSIELTCSTRGCSTSDLKQLPQLWDLIGKMKTHADELENIVRKNATVSEAYSFLFNFDKLITAHHPAYGYNAYYITNWSNNKQNREKMYGKPPVI